MNKNYLVLIIATMMLFSMGAAYAALGVGSWVDNNNASLNITVGQTAEFRYGITAVTSLNGKYSIMLYREGNTNPLVTYFNNQPTVGNGALGRINVTPANYGNAAGSYYVMIYSSDDYGSHSYRLDLGVAATQPAPITILCDVNPSIGYNPLNTQFTSTVTGGTGTYTYNWTFGDGTTNNNNVATSHTYTTGTYTTSLSIKDSANTIATANCGQITVNAVIPPNTLQTSCVATPLTGTAPMNIAITSQTSGGVKPYTYEWTYGDGSVTTNIYQTILSYTYYNAGVYPTSLKVTDANNNVAEATCGIINVAAPIPPLNATCTVTPTTGSAPLTVQINAQTTGGSGTYIYSWMFGDGQNGIITSTTDKNVTYSHTYTSANTYPISLQVVDSAGRSIAISCGQVVVTPTIIPINITCAANPTNGTTPLNTQFTSTVTGGTGTYTYNWTFGDGTTNNNNVATSHTYTTGTYTTSLSIKDSANTIATANCGQITVNEVILPLNVTCTANPTNGTAPLDVQFTSTVTGGIIPYNYNWIFGDGATASNQNTSTHTYVTAGTFNPTLSITDSQNTITIANCSNNGIIVAPPILNVQSIICFPRVTDGSNQSCSVVVESNNGLIPGNVNVDIYYTNGTLFGSCNTNALSGACEVENIVNGNGTQTVYANANAPGYINDTDMQPTFQFEVFTQRYDVVGLGTYNDSDFLYPQDTFYRGQPIYAKFQIFDPQSGSFVTDDIVTAASLISLPGGRIDLSEINYSNNWYYYQLDAIPLNHYFLGDSNVFAFAFNFTELTSGQAQVNLTILNNKPVTSSIADVYVAIGDNYSISLDNYAIDLEDQTVLTWNILNNPSLFSANIDANNVLTITGLVEGVESLTLRVYDLDNDFAETNITVHVTQGSTNNTLDVSCVALPDNGVAPLTLLLRAVVNGAATGPYTFTFDYGNGSTSTDNDNIRLITYDTAGIYNPTVNVIDSNGFSGTASCGFVVVTSNNGSNILNANIGGPYVGYINEALTFNASLSSGNIILYRWDFGDGTTMDSATPEVQHTYNKINKYNVILTVYGIYGNSDSKNTVVTVVERTAPPVIDTQAARDLPDRGIVVKNLVLGGENGEILGRNDELTARVSLKNEWDSKLKNVRVTLSIPELGLEAKSAVFDFSRGSERSEAVTLPLYDVAPGAYYVKIEIHNDQGGDEVRRIKYREIIVK